MMNIRKSNFGKLRDGKEVIKYHLENDEVKVNILNYGGIITEFFLKKEETKNLVLGFDKIEDYEEKNPYFGCITGRVAGRIANGKFKIDGHGYKLSINNGINNLHGGNLGLNQRIWNVKEIEGGIELSYLSPHMEEGFPGEVHFKVKYTIKGKSLRIDYSGETDRKTYVNLTNHTYFNLSGGEDSILSHDLTIDADKFLELNENSIPTGIRKDVAGSCFDRRNGGLLKEIITKSNHDTEIVGGGIDHPFILNKTKKIPIILLHQSSGRKLEVTTSEPVVVVYTGNYLKDEGLLNNGALSKKHMGVCLETQEYPDALNQNFSEIRYITPKKGYHSWTVFDWS